MLLSLKTLGLACALVGGLACAAGRALADSAPSADTLYYNGPIYTMTETPEEAAHAGTPRQAEVLATRDGRIVYVGSEAEARRLGYFEGARRLVDLKGKTLLPGFVDGHGHFPEQGQYDLYEINLNSRPLGPMISIAEYRRALGERCKAARPGEWVLGWGYDDTSIRDGRHPTRDDLDAACPDNPVYIRHISGHMGVANSKALDKAGVDAAHPDRLGTEGVVKDKGRPTGLLMETRAMGLVTSLPDFPHPDPQKSLARASHVYAAAGVTTADQGASMIALHLPLFQEGLARKNLPLRVVLHPLGDYRHVEPGGAAVDAAGWLNRAALGWRDAPSDGGPRFADGGGAVPTGGDISRLPTADGAKAAPSGQKDAATPGAEDLPSDRLFLGAWKLLFDGSPQGYTAWLKEPGYYKWGVHRAADSFDGAPYFNGAQGTLNLDPAQLEGLIGLYHRAGQSTETHVNGNAAAEAWIAALEKAVSASPDIEDTRHTAIHTQMMELQHVQRMSGNYADLEGTGHLYSGLGGAFRDGRLSPEEVGAPSIEALSELMTKQHLFNSYFVDHVYFWGERHKNIFMGPGRATNMSPVGWSVHYGQPYSFHSDTFVTPIHPLRSVQTAVTRTTAPSPLSEGGTLLSGTGKDVRATVELPARDPAEGGGTALFPTYDHRINTLQALLGVTRYPAWQNKLEDRLGSLREGLAADLVILEEDPFRVAEHDPGKLADIRVMATLVGDRPVYGFLPGTRDVAAPPVPAYIQLPGVDVALREDARPLGGDASSPAKGERRLGAYRFEAEARGGDAALFQMDFLGNGGPVRDMHLYRIEGPRREAFTYSPEGRIRGGLYWISPLKEPTRPLPPEATLAKDATYITFFALAPTTPGAREWTAQATVCLATSGPLPGNGGTTPEPGPKNRPESTPEAGQIKAAPHTQAKTPSAPQGETGESPTL